MNPLKGVYRIAKLLRYFFDRLEDLESSQKGLDEASIKFVQWAIPIIEKCVTHDQINISVDFVFNRLRFLILNGKLKASQEPLINAIVTYNYKTKLAELPQI